MKIAITGRNMQLTEALKEAVEKTFSRLDRFFVEDTPVNVTLSVEKERQKVEATIFVKGNVIRAEQTSNDMYVSIDVVEEIIERQVKKYRQKLIDRHQAAGMFNDNFMEADVPDDSEIQIVRTKRIGLKPMYPEDACIQMELLGHDFFVFRNADTDEVNVVYKRRGNTYGMIEPE